MVRCGRDGLPDTHLDEVVEAVPYLLGFHPRDSMVVVPLRPGPPTARIDVPRTEADRDQVAEQLLRMYEPVRASTAVGEAGVLVMAYSEDMHGAELASQDTSVRFVAHGVDVPARLWVTDRDWTDLASGHGGLRLPETQGRVAAEFAVLGRRAPAAEFVGDPTSVAALLSDVRRDAARSGEGAESAWTGRRIDAFLEDGRSLSDADAARVLVAVQDRGVRDDALLRVTTGDAPAHRALWADLTRRAPDEVRAPAAIILGFAAWLGGDGAAAWSALDRVPGRAQYRLAAVLGQALADGLPPSTWDAAARPQGTGRRSRPGGPPASGRPSRGATELLVTQTAQRTTQMTTVPRRGDKHRPVDSQSLPTSRQSGWASTGHRLDDPQRSPSRRGCR